MAKKEVIESASIADQYLAIAEDINRQIDLPRVRRIWLPKIHANPEKSAEFGAVILDDDSVGLMFMLLDDTLDKVVTSGSSENYVGLDPIEIARGFCENDPVIKALGLGALNAIGQHLIRRSKFPVDTKTNSIAALDPQPQDRIGMVGFFPPLVERLREQNIDLTVIELKPEMVQQELLFRVTLDPKALLECNKILCTSTMLLNDSIDSMLSYCEQADQVAIIGPTAGFLPDPLFARGIGTVGGNRIMDVASFITRCEAEEKWGGSSQKYCFHRDKYPGYQALLDGIL